MSQTGRGNEDEPGKVGRTMIAGTENVEVPGTEESRVCLEWRARGEVGKSGADCRESCDREKEFQLITSHWEAIKGC